MRRSQANGRLIELDLRLTPEQRRALIDALSPFDDARSRDRAVRGVERALVLFESRRHLEKKYDPRKRRQHLDDRIKAAEALLEVVSPTESFVGDDELHRFLEQRITEWRDVVTSLRWPSHRRFDRAVFTLGANVVAVLAAAGIPLQLSRGSAAVEVLGLVRRWADDLDGCGINRTDSYKRFARPTIEHYRKFGPTPVPHLALPHRSFADPVA